MKLCYTVSNFLVNHAIAVEKLWGNTSPEFHDYVGIKTRKSERTEITFFSWTEELALFMDPMVQIEEEKIIFSKLFKITHFWSSWQHSLVLRDKFTWVKWLSAICVIIPQLTAATLWKSHLPRKIYRLGSLGHLPEIWHSRWDFSPFSLLLSPFFLV